MLVSTLGRYVGWRFLTAAIAVFVGIFLLVTLIDYIEMTRRASNVAGISPLTVAAISVSRIPQITERLLPFSILIAGMVAFLALSRRNELVIARAAGISAWQFVAPAVLVAFAIGVLATLAYNPVAAGLFERSKRMEQENLRAPSAGAGSRFWIRQRSPTGQSILHAASSSGQGAALSGVTVFVFDGNGHFTERVEATSAALEPGQWRIMNARVFSTSAPPREVSQYLLSTNLTRAQIRESFATPETISFWNLPLYIDLAEKAGLGANAYRFQYQTLIAKPFLLAAMVLMAASVSLQFFRFGGVQKMVLGGVAGGFLLYILSKVTEDLSKAELMHPVTAAWSPVVVGAFIGTLILLFQEDG
jgi:lipopolysaccharide export system permease protein